MNNKASLRHIALAWLILIFFLQTADNYLRDASGRIYYLYILKNSMLTAYCLLFSCYLLIFKKKKFRFPKEAVDIISLCLVILLISLVGFYNAKVFTISTFAGIFKIIFPLWAAIVTFNMLTFKQLYQCMSVFLWSNFVAYIFAIGIQNFTLSNFLAIDLIRSYSPFETNFFSPQAVAFFIFFVYYRKSKINIYLSAIFTVLTFKRPMILLVFFLSLFAKYINTTKPVNEKLIWLTKISFVLITMLYVEFCMGTFNEILQSLVGMTADNLTKGRAWMFRVAVQGENMDFVFTSKQRFDIEMDLLLFYLELSIVGLIATVHYITNIGKRNYYAFTIVVFTLFEMLTSHWYDITYYWIVLYLTLFYMPCGEKIKGTYPSSTLAALYVAKYLNRERAN